MLSDAGGRRRWCTLPLLVIFVCLIPSVSGTICAGLTYYTANSTTQTFTSPDYPSNYGINVYCSWVLESTDTSLNVILTVTESSMENPNSDSSCVYDYVRVYDGKDLSSNLLGDFCGSKTVSLTSTSSSMLVVFNSDDDTVSTGFTAEFNAGIQTVVTTSKDYTIIIASSVSGFVFIVACIVICCCIRHHKLKKRKRERAESSDREKLPEHAEEGVDGTEDADRFKPESGKTRFVQRIVPSSKGERVQPVAVEPENTAITRVVAANAATAAALREKETKEKEKQEKKEQQEKEKRERKEEQEKKKAEEKAAKEEKKSKAAEEKRKAQEEKKAAATRAAEEKRATAEEKKLAAAKLTEDKKATDEQKKTVDASAKQEEKFKDIKTAQNQNPNATEEEKKQAAATPEDKIKKDLAAETKTAQASNEKKTPADGEKATGTTKGAAGISDEGAEKTAAPAKSATTATTSGMEKTVTETASNETMTVVAAAALTGSDKKTVAAEKKKAAEDSKKNEVEDKKKITAEEKKSAENDTKVTPEDKKTTTEENSKTKEGDKKIAAQEDIATVVTEKVKTTEDEKKTSAEDAKKMTAEEKKKAADDEKKRLADKRKQAAEEKKRIAEEKKKAEAEEKKRVVEEKKKAAEEKKRAAEEEKKRVEEEKKRAVEEKKKAEEEKAKRSKRKVGFEETTEVIGTSDDGVCDTGENQEIKKLIPGRAFLVTAAGAPARSSTSSQDVDTTNNPQAPPASEDGTATSEHNGGNSAGEATAAAVATTVASASATQESSSSQPGKPGSKGNAVPSATSTVVTTLGGQMVAADAQNPGTPTTVKDDVKDVIQLTPITEKSEDAPIKGKVVPAAAAAAPITPGGGTGNPQSKDKAKPNQDASTTEASKNAKDNTAKPGHAKPGSAKSVSAKPGSAKPGSAKPGSAKPASAKVGVAVPNKAGTDTTLAREGTQAGKAAIKDNAKPGSAKPASAKVGVAVPNKAGTDTTLAREGTQAGKAAIKDNATSAAAAPAPTNANINANTNSDPDSSNKLKVHGKDAKDKTTPVPTGGPATTSSTTGNKKNFPNPKPNQAAPAGTEATPGTAPGGKRRDSKLVLLPTNVLLVESAGTSKRKKMEGEWEKLSNVREDQFSAPQGDMTPREPSELNGPQKKYQSEAVRVKDTADAKVKAEEDGPDGKRRAQTAKSMESLERDEGINMDYEGGDSGKSSPFSRPPTVTTPGPRDNTVLTPSLITSTITDSPSYQPTPIEAPGRDEGEVMRATPTFSAPAENTVGNIERRINHAIKWPKPSTYKSQQFKDPFLYDVDPITLLTRCRIKAEKNLLAELSMQRSYTTVMDRSELRLKTLTSSPQPPPVKDAFLSPDDQETQFKKNAQITLDRRGRPTKPRGGRSLVSR